MNTFLLVTDVVLLAIFGASMISDFVLFVHQGRHLVPSYYQTISLIFLLMGIVNFGLMVFISELAFNLFLIALGCLFISACYAWCAR
ncbi:hypothetical protein A3K29_05100 [Candidatus Collierbacteria bacterium RIFOXYB2_FULL_46_14]|uniref:Uncharacterized protein n=1 Tax=Candidatus Collierbacteria bacterium GW2011_GWA2_46_26 TaxID=1618381 RepID=A0A0G1PJP5_9BACT|nr:MAG: hypothetical protein UX47_C0006G0015 [Candidatus Collierbacteria bacterium GW2011_GWA2_46_26]OGD73472.1 MAG: hypothetical protein A3K29_05100 [Candidatus Collierbacteria bacterium RIFOXYB2_FULL_46_14]OGD76514.1 MAG: hypothetical protein A3K43_05100 [Candidatus Collierbacteria bacterium RIFOXYA2_FULL_46_20]OGD77850.1 MAG: hypothetical protein A3K39_05100 [Candidatus Collierbacteria bacterium RIFOXYC2_FULL_43_15]OGD81141.1 MAG: hypothetical protein A2320_05600 [Pseudomonadales bacterium G